MGEQIVKFSYKAYLTEKIPESPSKAIILAHTEAENGQESRREIVVKFVRRYNANAHHLLAIAGRAPELIYCSDEDPNSPNLAGLIMVAMEYVNGNTAHQQYGNQELPQPILDQVEEALAILHAKNIVFADLCHPNIMINKDERVQTPNLLQTIRECAVKVFSPTFSKTATSNTLLPHLNNWQHL